jgi:hypothetical protein
MANRAKDRLLATAVRVLITVAQQPIAMLDHASQHSVLALAPVQEMSALTAAAERMARPAKGAPSVHVALQMVTVEPSLHSAVLDASTYRPVALNLHEI